MKGAGASSVGASTSASTEGGAGGSGGRSGAGVVHRMYVGQLPAGARLYPPGPLDAEPEGGRSVHGAPGEEWVEVPLGGVGGSGRMGVDMPGGGGLPQRVHGERAPPQQRSWRQLSVAYVAAGVYLWGAPRDTRYRERVHGTGRTRG